MTGMNVSKWLISATAALALAACGGSNSGSGGTASVVEGDVVLGDASAPVTIIEYASITCSHCATFSQEVMPTIEERVEAGDVKFIFRGFPTQPVEIAMAGHAIAHCAGEDRFYDVLHDLFENQTNIFQAARTGTVGDALQATAARHGLDATEFRACTRNQDLYEQMSNVIRDAQAQGVSGTPTIFINGELAGPEAQTPEGMNELIDAALAD